MGQRKRPASSVPLSRHLRCGKTRPPRRCHQFRLDHPFPLYHQYLREIAGHLKRPGRLCPLQKWEPVLLAIPHRFPRPGLSHNNLNRQNRRNHRSHHGLAHQRRTGMGRHTQGRGLMVMVRYTVPIQMFRPARFRPTNRRRTPHTAEMVASITRFSGKTFHCSAPKALPTPARPPSTGAKAGETASTPRPGRLRTFQRGRLLYPRHCSLCSIVSCVCAPSFRSRHRTSAK